MGMTRFLLCAGLATTPVLAGSGCDEQRKQVTGAVDKAATETAKALDAGRKTFLDKSNQALAELDTLVDTAEKRAADPNAEWKKDLEAKQARIRFLLDQAGKSAGENWRSVQGEVDELIQETRRKAEELVR